ncbi:unnamed protein product [Caenorhabditis nigoni]
MPFVCIDISDVIKYIFDRIGNFDKPETATSSDYFTTSANQNILKVGHSEQTPTTSSNTSVMLSNPVAIATSTQKSPKVGILGESTSNVSIQPPPSKATSDEQQISILALASHIESIAQFTNLDSLQKMASRAIEQINNSGEDKVLAVVISEVLINLLKSVGFCNRLG